MILSDCTSIKTKTGRRTEEYIGNNKKYSITENSNHIRIIGNGNKIYLTTNTGTVEIIGNSSNLRIIHNNGSVVFTGNDGTILLGNDSLVKSIKYVGCNGTVKVVSGEKLLAVQKQSKLMASSTLSSSLPLQPKHADGDDCSNLFDRKFNKFANSFSLNNLNIAIPKVDLGNVVKIGQCNIVINRN
ncbi:hypothetical protein HA402_014355 [Bradysia odoriphaga]|nr:hypothetical protein HA402_014355 [Bradysia odoriphaga]